MGAATDSDRWVWYSIGAALVAIGQTALVYYAPMWEWTWILLVGVVVFVVMMARHPDYWFRRVATWLISLAGLSAAIPSFLAKFFPHQQFGFKEFAVNNSPIAAVAFIAAAVLFGLFELVRILTAGKTIGAAPGIGSQRKKRWIEKCEQVQAAMIPDVDSQRSYEKRPLRICFVILCVLFCLAMIFGIIAVVTMNVLWCGLVAWCLAVWLGVTFYAKHLDRRQDYYLGLRAALLDCDQDKYEESMRHLGWR